MAFLRCSKLRYLYLLALVQLVGGPLVLLHVTVFCKLTLDEAPRMGVAAAAMKAWHAEGFQEALVADFSPEKNGRRDGDKPKPEPDKAKQPPIPWGNPVRRAAPHEGGQSIAERAVTWTPRWPNAPPGPPPRFA